MRHHAPYFANHLAQAAQTAQASWTVRRLWWALLSVPIIGVLWAGFAPDAQAQSTQAAQAGRWSEHSIAVDGQQRVYRIYRGERLPAAQPGAAPVSLAAAVLVLHGGTQSMRKIFDARSGGATVEWVRIADREGLVLIAPNGSNRETGESGGDNQNWRDFRRDTIAKPVDDVAFIKALLAQEVPRQGLNPQRVFVTGASNGGMMSMRLMVEAPQLFAAAAVFIAALPDDLATVPKPAVAKPLLMFNGQADRLVKWEGGLVANDQTRGKTSSVAATLAWWQGVNQVETAQVAEQALPDLDPSDGCTIGLSVFPKKAGVHNAAPIWFYRAAGGGHNMPTIKHHRELSALAQRIIGNTCKDAEGAELSWSFFSQH